MLFHKSCPSNATPPPSSWSPAADHDNKQQLILRWVFLLGEQFISLLPFFSSSLFNVQLCIPTGIPTTSNHVLNSLVLNKPTPALFFHNHHSNNPLLPDRGCQHSKHREPAAARSSLDNNLRFIPSASRPTRDTPPTNPASVA
jgi:hypothetical protein